ncbi:MAG: TaqI-like C-terminal specificity domain-containing protein, partial [Chloroflexota bacterium]|nr:TaqI-like C-terminal specificity domain-containing protein [Chloroflexota bacterium]
DVTLLKRHVLKRCIYGVDLNPMAVELAKVSVWLDCFTLGAPLSFLDHHLRWGNSLIGAMAREVEEEMADPRPDGQMTFLTGPFTGLLRAAEIMRGISGIADVTLEQVQESGHLFEAFDQAATPYKQLLDIHVARHFGVERAQEFLTLYGAEAIEAQPEELGKPYREVVERTRELYEEKRFFHWDLEFPEVFIDLEHAAWKKDGGFDAVVGNPPYQRIQGLRTVDPAQVEYFSRQYRSAQRNYDIYVLFDELGLRLLAPAGTLGYIQPHKFFQAQFGSGARELLADHLRRIVDFGHNLIFGQEASTYTCLLFLSSASRRQLKYARVNESLSSSRALAGRLADVDFDTIRVPESDADTWTFGTEVGLAILDRMEHLGTSLGKIANKVFVGLQTSADAVYFLDMRERVEPGLVKAFSTASDRTMVVESRFLKPLLKGKDVSRYVRPEPKTWVIFPYDTTDSSPRLLEKDEIRHSAPRLWEYLKEHEEVLRGREDGKMDHDEWWGYVYPKNLGYFPQRKLLTPDICGKGELTIDVGKNYHTTTVYSIILRDSFSITLSYVLAVMNSRLVWFFLTRTGTVLRGGYLRFKTAYLEPVPVRRIRFTTPQSERERLVAGLITRYRRDKHGTLLTEVGVLLPKNEEGDFLAFQPGASGAEGKSDVVHDLLAYLAEQMIAMNEEKQERIKAFWDDLEAACESPGTFEDLHEHGKWEQSLWKDPACRPYVDKESRSTRHLDESLGWDEACYEAFAGMLAGKTSVARPMIDVYRKHHAAYKALVERIEATDRLIDQIVYRLYGLTEEEIAVVQGGTTTSS